MNGWPGALAGTERDVCPTSGSICLLKEHFDEQSVDVPRGHDGNGHDVVGYVAAIDGSIGKIDSSTADTDNAHVVVDTGWWIFGKKRLIPAGAIVAVDHQDQKVALQMTKDQVKDAPDFDETVTLTAADRGVYDDYYRPLAGSPSPAGPSHTADSAAWRRWCRPTPRSIRQSSPRGSVPVCRAAEQARPSGHSCSGRTPMVNRRTVAPTPRRCEHVEDGQRPIGKHRPRRCLGQVVSTGASMCLSMRESVMAR